MPRRERKFSNSKVYHIIFRGIDKQNIFYDDQDRRVFLTKLKQIKEEFHYKIYAYCLMSNHVHIIMKSENEYLSTGMKSLLLRYGHYFNKKYERVGTYLQNRFYSKNVENSRYFIDVCRYVHRNPENAGICQTQDYVWSSFKEYITQEDIIDKNALMYYFDNDINEFIKFTTRKNITDLDDFAEYEIMNKLSDRELMEIISKKFRISNIENVSNFFIEMTNKELEEYFKDIQYIKGTNLTQLARVMRVARGRLKKCKK